MNHQSLGKDRPTDIDSMEYLKLYKTLLQCLEAEGVPRAIDQDLSLQTATGRYRKQELSGIHSKIKGTARYQPRVKRELG